MTVTEQYRTTASVTGFSGLDPLLAQAVVMVLASSLNPATFEPGDSIPNQGTAGSAGNAKSGTGSDEPFPTGAAGYTSTPLPGVLIDPTGDGLDFYYLDPIAALDVDTFTAFAWVTWTEESGVALSNVMSKVSGGLGAGGAGWQVADFGSGTGLTATAAVVSAGGTNPGTDPAFSVSTDGLLDQGSTHLIVVRVVDASELTLFIDGEEYAAASMAGVSSTITDHEWIFGRGMPQTGHGWGFWARALTDTEITVDLPTALGLP